MIKAKFVALSVLSMIVVSCSGQYAIHSDKTSEPAETPSIAESESTESSVLNTLVPQSTATLIADTPTPRSGNLSQPFSTLPAELSIDHPIPTPISTPLLGGGRLVLYGFLFNSGLVAYSIPVSSGEIALSPINIYELIPVPETPNNSGPGQAFALAFANNSDRAAYWIIGQPGRLWISDLDLKEQHIVFEDINSSYPKDLGSYGAIQLEWLFGDSFLLLSVEGQPELNLLYSEEMGLVMQFPFHCGILAISPQTNRPSLWCSNTGNSGNWVLEANGNWWQSEDGPESILVRESTSGPLEWDWTPSGALVFFDYERDESQLTILQDGDLRYLPINSFAEMSQSNSIPSSLWFDVYPTIRHFGLDSSHILVHGTPLESGICPATKFRDQLYEPAPCWMVADIRTGEIVWGLIDLVEDPRLGIPEGDISVLDFKVPILSPDGHFLAISENDFGGNTYIIDLTSAEVLTWFPFVSEDYSFATSE